MAPSYQIRAGGKVFGPFTFEQLMALKARGQLQSNHEVSDDGQTWRSAGTLPGLFDNFGNSFGPFDGSPEWDANLMHSGYGVASFTIAVLAIIVVSAGIGYAIVIAVNRPGGQIDERSPVAIFAGLSILASMLAQLLALGLGIAGAVQRNRKKVFAVLGIILSLMMLLCVTGLMVIGMAKRH